jgi:shikimate kinase
VVADRRGQAVTPVSRHVVLTGLMGSGKSTIGRLVAERTGLALLDVDEAITARTGRTVRELWEEGGEAAYRELESGEVLAALERADPVVIAAPGGVVLDARVRAALTGAFVVWLRADPATLSARVSRGDHRPLLGDDPRTVLERMAVERSDLYQDLADLVVDVDDGAPEELAERVVAAAPR